VSKIQGQGDETHVFFPRKGLMLLLVSSGVEPVSVDVGELIVGAGASFDFADSGATVPSLFMYADKAYT
jgi:hypothetical protein